MASFLTPQYSNINCNCFSFSCVRRAYTIKYSFSRHTCIIILKKKITFHLKQEFLYMTSELKWMSNITVKFILYLNINTDHFKVSNLRLCHNQAGYKYKKCICIVNYKFKIGVKSNRMNKQEIFIILTSCVK